MSAAARSLPDFEDPPVVETAFGIEFEPIKEWTLPFYGLYWQTIRDRYPKASVQPPITTPDLQISSRPKPPLSIEVVLSAPEVRCWFIDRDESHLIQLQNDRLIHNWRKAAQTHAYPHYERIRPQLQQEWQEFIGFLERNSLPKPAVRLCEVTYVNHIERGHGWESFSDLPGVLSGWTGAGSTGFLPNPELVVMEARYPITATGGKLQVTMQPAIRHMDAREVIQLTLTARCTPASPDVSDVFAALDLGREWVVKGFTDLTSVKMHQIWKRIV